MGCSALRGKSFVPHNSPVLTSSDFRIILNSFLKLEEEEQIKIALLDASHTHTQTHTFAQQHLRPFLSPLLLSPSTARFARFARLARFGAFCAFCAFCASSPRISSQMDSTARRSQAKEFGQEVGSAIQHVTNSTALYISLWYSVESVRSNNTFARLLSNN